MQKPRDNIHIIGFKNHRTINNKIKEYFVFTSNMSKNLKLLKTIKQFYHNHTLSVNLMMKNQKRIKEDTKQNKNILKKSRIT